MQLNRVHLAALNDPVILEQASVFGVDEEPLRPKEVNPQDGVLDVCQDEVPSVGKWSQLDVEC